MLDETDPSAAFHGRGVAAGKDSAAAGSSLIDPATVRVAVDDGVRRYFADRHHRVAPFVDRHFTLSGALALHRHALGWDLLKAPANLVLTLPQTGLKAAAGMAARAGAGRLARRLDRQQILFRTRVGEELEYLLMAELLELPFRSADRVSVRDALAETILADGRVAGPLRDVLAAVASRGQDPAFDERLREVLQTYAGTRAAAAEIATALLSMAAGAALLQQFTPGAMALGSSLAAAAASKVAIASFPLGTGLGALWYGALPAAVPPLLVAGMTGGVVLAAAALSPFAGVVADPVQRRLGLHQRRLHRMLQSLERQVFDPAAAGFVVRDHYVARLMDVFDLLSVIHRLARS